MKMSKIELSSQDQKEIENCVKHLVYKFVQTVVQSRQGERLSTRSKKLISSSDWFNLTIPDQPDVHDATKRAYSGSVDLSQPLCVEISLMTAEQEKMTLEYWYLQQTDKTSMPDSSFKVPLTVYNAVGVLLKSVVVVSRSTPVYQLSRRQKIDNFSICYSVYVREPSIFSLGDEFQRQLIGIVPSPLGAITSYVIHRTKMSTYRQQSLTDLTSTIKDDHFYKPLNRNRNARNLTGFDSTEDKMMMTVGMSPGHRTTALQQDAPLHDGSLKQKRAAFGITVSEVSKLIDEAEIENDLPFATLLVPASSPPVASRQTTSDSETTDGMKADVCVSTDGRLAETTAAATKDDFVMVELRAPFVGNEDDLGRFYRECQMAPTLSMFEQTGSLQDMINSITDQLTQFEASASEFTDFVNSLEEFD